MIRTIALSDGTTMWDELIIFETNAPIELLKELEKVSCQLYANGGDYEDIPNWSKTINDKGYLFDYVDSHTHINQFSTSNEWLCENYPKISEHYIIENQPQNN